VACQGPLNSFPIGSHSGNNSVDHFTTWKPGLLLRPDIKTSGSGFGIGVGRGKGPRVLSWPVSEPGFSFIFLSLSHQCRLDQAFPGQELAVCNRPEAVPMESAQFRCCDISAFDKIGSSEDGLHVDCLHQGLPSCGRRPSMIMAGYGLCASCSSTPQLLTQILKSSRSEKLNLSSTVYIHLGLSVALDDFR
jgi:hypothetical protein